MGFLRLRDVAIFDADILFEWLRDSEAVRWAFSPAQRKRATRTEHTDWLGAWMQRNRYSEFRDYWWVLDDEDSLALLGQIRLERRVLTPESGLGSTPMGGREYFIVSLFVDKAHRGKGYGPLMLRIAERRTMGGNLPFLAFIREGNEASVRAFEKVEYEEVWRGEWMGKAAIVMMKVWGEGWRTPAGNLGGSGGVH